MRGLTKRDGQGFVRWYRDECGVARAAFDKVTECQVILFVNVWKSTKHSYISLILLREKVKRLSDVTHKQRCWQKAEPGTQMPLVRALLARTLSVADWTLTLLLRVRYLRLRGTVGGRYFIQFVLQPNVDRQIE